MYLNSTSACLVAGFSALALSAIGAVALAGPAFAADPHVAVRVANGVLFATASAGSMIPATVKKNSD
jgi:hypothetical protein